MKVLTDPETGMTTCELYKQDRKTLATAKTVFEKMAIALRKTTKGVVMVYLADSIGEVLAGKTPSPPAAPEKEKS